LSDITTSSASEQDLRARVERALAPAYTVEGELGRGGAGIVYRALDTRLKRNVAVKILPPDLAFRSDVRDRFMREAETSARLTHPNIVPIYSVDEKDGLAFFIMGLVEGENLGDRVKIHGPLPVNEVINVLKEVASALTYAHGRGVVHRDIKPDNILIDAESGRALVSDFGIARAATEGNTRLTATGTAIGTPAYMSPEQCAGDRQLDGRSDLYSLGAVAYYMLTGRPPFDGPTTPVVMMKQVTERAAPIDSLRGGVPQNLQRIVMKLLEKDPASRFGDGQELLDAFEGGPVYTESTPSSYPTIQTSFPALENTLGGRGGSWYPPPMAPINPLPMMMPGPAGMRARMDARELRREARERWKEQRESAKPLPERIKSFKRHFATSMGTSFFLFGINAATNHHFWWAVFPAMGMGISLVTEWGKLWSHGVRVRDIFGTPRDLPASVAPAAITSSKQPSTDSDTEQIAEVLAGPRGSVARQAVADRRAIKDLVGRFTKADRELLPDVESTAEGLYQRIAELGRALHRLDNEVGPDRLNEIDSRIATTENSGGADADRLVRLLKRQREQLASLLESRDKLSGQYESAGLLLQNLKLDLIRMRSSGLQSGLADVTSATQEARALSKEIGYVLQAADELKDIS
jgi:serine/threonine-protein kinase